MELLYIVHSQAIRHESNGLASILGILPELKMKYIPGRFSFAVSFGIDGVDVTSEHRISVQFKDPDGNIVIDSGGETTVFPQHESPGAHRPDGNFLLSGFQVVNIEINTEGRYTTEIRFDGELFKSQHIAVRKAGSNDKPE